VKRRVGLILLLLVAGAIVNVAVAWACALWSVPTFFNPMSDSGDEMIWWQGNASEGFPTAADQLVGNRTWGTDYVMMMALNKSINAMSYNAFRLRSGWPTRALERSYWVNYDMGTRDLRYSLVLDEGSKPARIVPLRPLWPGFAINTVFYAGILWGGWMLFAAPFALRRWRRVKRGLCPACAYPIGDSAVCTECGGRVRHFLNGESER
jgi:hypothetical protein